MTGTSRAATFGETLAMFRKQNRMSQSEVARRAGFDHSYVSRLERGEREPTRTSVESIAVVMGLTAVETDMLLLSAGYAPNEPAVLLGAEPEVATLYLLLSREEVPEAVRAFVRAKVLALVDEAATMTGNWPDKERDVA